MKTTETQAARAAARARGAAAQMDRAKSLAASAQELAMDAIVQGARAVLRTGPLASEYVQAMGSWSFTVIIPLQEADKFFEADLRGNEQDLQRLISAEDEMLPEYVRHVAPLVEAVRTFRELHATYEKIFGNTAAGEPMRFDATSPITRDW